MRAGVSSLNEFGWLNTVDRLAGGDATRWKEAMTLSFAEAIVKLELENKKGEFMERLHKIKSEKK